MVDNVKDRSVALVFDHDIEALEVFVGCTTNLASREDDERDPAS